MSSLYQSLRSDPPFIISSKRGIYSSYVLDIGRLERPYLCYIIRDTILIYNIVVLHFKGRQTDLSTYNFVIKLFIVTIYISCLYRLMKCEILNAKK
jgi:hypothetical protein